MTFQEIFNLLQGLGTEQNRKIYIRHGSGQNTYGVSFANLKKIAKGIGQDHEIAMALWESENVDAQALATMIMNPAKITQKSTEKWLKRVTYPVLLGLLAGVVSKTEFAAKAVSKWTSSKDEFIKACGFNVASYMLKNDFELPITTLKFLLQKIENEMHNSPNQARVSMNNALIAIGMYCPALTATAMKVAKEIGKIEIDHGETNCKTPNSKTYIEKALAKIHKKK